MDNNESKPNHLAHDIALPDLVKYKPARFLKPGRLVRCILYKRVVL